MVKFIRLPGRYEYHYFRPSEITCVSSILGRQDECVVTAGSGTYHIPMSPAYVTAEIAKLEYDNEQEKPDEPEPASVADSLLRSARDFLKRMPSGDDLQFRGAPLTEFNDEELRKILKRFCDKRNEQLDADLDDSEYLNRTI